MFGNKGVTLQTPSVQAFHERVPKRETYVGRE